MRALRITATVLALTLLVTVSPTLAESRCVNHHEVQEGHRFCPQRTLVLSGMAVRGGRCYVLAILRDRRGAFFAFINPNVQMPHRQVVRLDSDEGRKVRGRVIYLVPMPGNSQVALIPVNTIQLIRLREDDEEDEDEEEGDRPDGEHHYHVVSSNFTVILTTAPTPNILVTFVVNF